jgi:hypothetical protein
MTGLQDGFGGSLINLIFLGGWDIRLLSSVKTPLVLCDNLGVSITPIRTSVKTPLALCDNLGVSITPLRTSLLFLLLLIVLTERNYTG